MSTNESPDPSTFPVINRGLDDDDSGPILAGDESEGYWEAVEVICPE